MRLNVLATSALLGATTVLGACSDSTNASANRPASVSFSTAASAGASFSMSPEPGASRSVTTTSGTNTIVITKAQIVVARMELERVGASCASGAAAGDDANEEHDCAELTLAPSIVDLPVDATITSPLQIMIPAGTYKALEAKIRAVRSDADHGTASAAFLTAHPEFAGASVRIEGTYNGKSFIYTGAPRAEFEKEFNPALVVDAKPLNVTVKIDMASWFKDASGALIDPSSTSTSDMSMILDNMRRSFKAFHDDDHNGVDDEIEHH